MHTADVPSRAVTSPTESCYFQEKAYQFGTVYYYKEFLYGNHRKKG